MATSDDTSNQMCSASPRDGWFPIALAPDDCDFELGHPRLAGIEALGFPCPRNSGVWYNAWTDEAVLAIRHTGAFGDARPLDTPLAGRRIAS